VGIYSRIVNHRAMVFDEVRNSAYADAIKSLVKPGQVVLDLGSGLGIHGLVAAANNARHVYLVDPSPVTAVAREIADDNGLGDKVTCIQKPIEEAGLPEPVDMIVSVFTGNFLLEEDLLPSLFFAREKYLKPGGLMVPDRGEMRVVPVCAGEYFEKNVRQWSKTSQGISFESVRKKASNTLYFDDAGSREAQMLTEPKTLKTLDFHSAEKADCDSEVKFEAVHSGKCHGFLGWFRIRVGNRTLSTSPLAPSTHWNQAFLPLDPPIDVQAGDLLTLRVVRPQFGPWTWMSNHCGESQQHSTFFSRLFSVDQMKRRSGDHSAVLNDHGELVQFVIDSIIGHKSNSEILTSAIERFGSRYASEEYLNRQVVSLISKLSE